MPSYICDSCGCSETQEQDGQMLCKNCGAPIRTKNTQTPSDDLFSVNDSSAMAEKRALMENYYASVQRKKNKEDWALIVVMMLAFGVIIVLLLCIIFNVDLMDFLNP